MIFCEPKFYDQRNNQGIPLKFNTGLGYDSPDEEWSLIKFLGRESIKILGNQNNKVEIPTHREPVSPWHILCP